MSLLVGLLASGDDSRLIVYIERLLTILSMILPWSIRRIALLSLLYLARQPEESGVGEAKPNVTINNIQFHVIIN